MFGEYESAAVVCAREVLQNQKGTILESFEIAWDLNKRVKTKNSNFYLFINGDDVNINMRLLHLFWKHLN